MHTYISEGRKKLFSSFCNNIYIIEIGMEASHIIHTCTIHQHWHLFGLWAVWSKLLHIKLPQLAGEGNTSSMPFPYAVHINIQNKHMSGYVIITNSKWCLINQFRSITKYILKFETKCIINVLLTSHLCHPPEYWAERPPYWSPPNSHTALWRWSVVTPSLTSMHQYQISQSVSLLICNCVNE